MTRLLLALSFAASLFGADYLVKASGGDYTTISDALTAIGTTGGEHTITLEASETHAVSSSIVLAIRKGANWLTIRSSRWRELPEGVRVAVGDSRLATINITGTTSGFVYGTDPAFSQTTWASTAAGNVVTIGSDCSAGNPCTMRDTAGAWHTFTAPPCTVTMLGQSIPTSGTSGAQGTGLRVGLDVNGVCQIAHKTDVSLTTHFTCTNCADGLLNASYAFTPNSVPLANIAYSTAGAVTSVRFRGYNWLSGPVVDNTLLPGIVNGPYSGIYRGSATGVHHVRWIGVDFKWNTTAEGYTSTMHYKAGGQDYSYVPHHIEFDRCVFRQPKASYGYYRYLGLQNCDNCAVQNSAFVNCQTRAEGQAILMTGGLGPLYINNISIDGCTEGILIGGASQMFPGVPEIRLERSYFKYRWEQWGKSRLIRQASTDTLALTGTDGTTRCNSVTCQQAYENTWYTYSQDSTITVASGQAAKVFVTVASDGTFNVYHNGNVTCAGDFTCVDSTTSRSSFPDDAVKWEWTAAAGAWNAADDWHVYYGTSGTSAWVNKKNHFEFKLVRNGLVRGIVSQYFWADAQNQPVGVAIRNQNGQDITAAADGFVFERSKVVTGHSGFNIFACDTYGLNTYGRNLHLRHLMFLDNTKASYGNTTSGGYSVTMGSFGCSATVSLPGIARHITADIDQVGIHTPSCSTARALDTLLVYDSLWLWNPATFWGISGDGIGAWNAVRTPDGVCSPSGFGLIGPSSRYEKNLNIGTGTISNTNWGTNWGDLASENFYGNVRLSSATLADHLTSISTPMALGDNLRIKPTSVYSVHNANYAGPATTDGTDAGADVDWVETLTDGVPEGYAPLAQRWGLKVHRSGTTATIYCVNSSTMTLNIGPYQSMKSGDLVVSADATPDSDIGGFKRWDVTGLSTTTIYWATLSDGTKTWKGRL